MPRQLITDIRVGKRYRRDLGDVGSLAASIAEVGLLHPIVVHTDGRLIAGTRRLEACKLLKWDKIPTTVIDLEKIVRGEYAENAFRKNLTPEEKVDVRRAVEPLEKAAAKARRGGDHKGKAGKFPELKGSALDRPVT